MNAVLPNKPISDRVADRRAALATRSVADPIDLARAGGTIPSCDHVLLAFAMTLAQERNWTVPQLCEFLAKPYGERRRWNLWLRELAEVQA